MDDDIKTRSSSPPETFKAGANCSKWNPDPDHRFWLDPEKNYPQLSLLSRNKNWTHQCLSYDGAAKLFDFDGANDVCHRYSQPDKTSQQFYR